VALDDGKQYLVESRLAPILRQRKLESIGDLVAQLRLERNGDLERQIVEALVTTESSFFRDLHPFESLRNVLLPYLIHPPRSSPPAAPRRAAWTSGVPPRPTARNRTASPCSSASTSRSSPGGRSACSRATSPATRSPERGRASTTRSRSTAAFPPRFWSDTSSSTARTGKSTPRSAPWSSSARSTSPRPGRA